MGEKMSRNKLYTERIEACISKTQMKALKREADNNKKTMNQIIRDMLTAYLNEK
jgi:hypothetical protein